MLRSVLVLCTVLASVPGGAVHAQSTSAPSLAERIAAVEGRVRARHAQNTADRTAEHVLRELGLARKLLLSKNERAARRFVERAERLAPPAEARQ